MRALLSVKSSNCAAVVNICGGSCGCWEDGRLEPSAGRPGTGDGLSVNERFSMLRIC